MKKNPVKNIVFKNVFVYCSFFIIFFIQLNLYILLIIYLFKIVIQKVLFLLQKIYLFKENKIEKT